MQSVRRTMMNIETASWRNLFMLTTLQEMIAMAEKGNYCIPAFNVYNVETVMGVMDAAEELKAPVIMQLYPRLVNGEVGYYVSPAALAAAAKASVPV